MGLMDVIRKAEEQSRRAARRGMERARATWDETERRLRRKMRINRPSANHPATLQEVSRTASVQNISEGTRELRAHGELTGSGSDASRQEDQRRRA